MKDEGQRVSRNVENKDRSSVAVLAEASLRPPRKLYICIIRKHIYRIKVSKKKKIEKELNQTEGEYRRRKKLRHHEGGAQS